MRFGTYLRSSVWDFILCAVASSALCYVCLVAFLSTLPVRDMPWIVIGACVLLSAYLVAIAYNMRSAAIGAIVLVAGAVAGAFGAWSASSASTLFEDVPGNYAFFIVVAVLCAAAVFVLSRHKDAAVVLLVGGVILCCAIEYLYWDGQVVATMVFCVAVACLIAHRNYRQSLVGSDSEEVSFAATTLSAATVSVLSVLLAAGVFMLFIAPANPPSLTMKLITKHVRLDEEHVVGTGDQVSIINEILLSWNVSGTTPDSSTSEGGEPEADDNDQAESGQEAQDTGGSAFNIDGTDVDLSHAVSFAVPDWLPFAVPIALLLLIALVIAVRKLVRHRRYKRIRVLPEGEQVKALYLMFLEAFRKMKMAQPGSQTLREYAAAAQGELRRFERAEGDEVAFTQLTETYVDVVYGDSEPSAEELAGFYAYYKSFYRNARHFVGFVRYLVLFFRI